MALASNGIMLDSMTIGDLVMVNSLLFQLSIPLNFLGSTYRDIRQSLVDLKSLFDLLSTETKIENSVDSKTLLWPEKINKGDDLIKFENVTFSYKNHPVLRNLSFTIPYGQKIAIVGGSGSGKSTIVRLLYRFFNPDEGEIYILGQNYKNLTLESVRKKISVVPQDQVLFHNTIMYNIKYGNINSTQEEIYRVAKIAGLDETIRNFSKGYSTQVGERGLKLSGGEKQRVAIARAILKDSPFFVYDEATSSLDSITEKVCLICILDKKIISVLSQLFKDRTSLVIAHRLSTIVDSDQILTLRDGCIAEKGKHIDLLIKSPLGPYAQLWNKQHEIITTPKIQEQEQDFEDILNQAGCLKEGCCSK
uniref:Iron-sulfur clusters transporter ABCB7, mitochondrial n=1 Tax=Henneguya salminicola TaxID=69463 RepID=A0A6G3MEK8_HENSL